MDHPPHQPGLRAGFLGRVQRPLDDLREFLGKPFLGNIIGRPALEGLDGDFLAAFGGHQDDGNHRVFFADFAHEFQPVHVGHLQIGQHEIGQMQLNLLEGRRPVGRIVHLPVGVFLQEAPGEFAVHRRIIHNEYSHHDPISHKPSAA